MYTHTVHGKSDTDVIHTVSRVYGRKCSGRRTAGCACDDLPQLSLRDLRRYVALMFV